MTTTDATIVSTLRYPLRPTAAGSEIGTMAGGPFLLVPSEGEGVIRNRGRRGRLRFFISLTPLVPSAQRGGTSAQRVRGKPPEAAVQSATATSWTHTSRHCDVVVSVVLHACRGRLEVRAALAPQHTAVLSTARALSPSPKHLVSPPLLKDPPSPVRV
jgi:hypothetical protein